MRVHKSREFQLFATVIWQTHTDTHYNTDTYLEIHALCGREGGISKSDIAKDRDAEGAKRRSSVGAEVKMQNKNRPNNNK